MTPLDLWHECRRRSVILAINGQKLTYLAPAGATENILPTLKENRAALIECLVALDGALFADGPFWPWGPFLRPESLKQWKRDLFEVVDALAKLERWSDDHYDIVIGAIERQPISTLRPDLAHFRERLDKARAEAATGRKREPR